GGQRERNMFGRPQKEFAGSPVTVIGDRVIAQTELGTVAALDLFTGRILWESRYSQIALPRTHNYNAPPRQVIWARLSAPVVVDDVVVCAPSDSMDLSAFSLIDGKTLWSYRQDQLQRKDEHEGLGFSQLVGADHDAVYLSGRKLAALQKPGGLATAPMFQVRWSQPLERECARALLTPDAVLVPSANLRTAYDLRTGAKIDALSGPWKRNDAGNVWVEDGALFSLAAQGVAGYCDWQTMLERARLAAESAKRPEPMRRAAELFQRRGEKALEERSLPEASERLRTAAELYARPRAAGGRSTRSAQVACA